jgi:hypothetical protein
MPAPGLDEDGYFKREGDLARVSPAFAPVVAAAKAAICDAFSAEHLHSAYLYGSIPRGTAVSGVSDLDALLALRHEPTSADRDTVGTLESNARLKVHPDQRRGNRARQHGHPAQRP